MSHTLRLLSDEEVDIVAGGSGSSVSYLGNNQWLYTYADGSWSVGSDYNNDGWNDITTYSNGSTVYGSADIYGSSYTGAYYGGVSGGYYGLVGGVSQVYGGDTYLTFGVGTPGFSVEGGYTTTGDLSGFGINYSVPVGPGSVTGNVLDPYSGGYQLGSFGTFGVSATYTVNATDMYNQAYNNTVGSMSDLYNAYSYGVYSTQVAPYTDPYGAGSSPMYYAPSGDSSWYQQMYEYVAAGIINGQ